MKRNRIPTNRRDEEQRHRQPNARPGQRRFKMVAIIAAMCATATLMGAWKVNSARDPQSVVATRTSNDPAANDTGVVFESRAEKIQRIQAEAKRIDDQLMASRRDRQEREFYQSRTDSRDARHHWQQRVSTTQKQMEESMRQDGDAIRAALAAQASRHPAHPVGPASVAPDPFAQLRAESQRRHEEDAPSPY